MPIEIATQPPPFSSLWFGLLAGPLAWSVQIVAAAFIAEAGGVPGADHSRWFDVPFPAWLIAGFSLAAAAIAGAATLMAQRLHRRFRRANHDPGNAMAMFMAKAGLATSSGFLLLIVAQTAPLVFLLRDC